VRRGWAQIDAMTDLIAGTKGLDVGRALAGAFAVVGRRWPWVLAAILLVAWAPQVLVMFGYTPIITRLRVAASDPWVSIGFTSVALLVGLYMRATVTALALDLHASMPRALGAAATAIPALAPLWLVALAPNLTRGALRQLAHAPFTAGNVAAQNVIVAAVTWSLAFVLALTLGVFAAVAIAERRGLLGTVTRTARLMSAGRWGFLGLYLIFQLAAAIPAVGMTLVYRLMPMSGDIALISQLRSLSVELLSDAVQALWAVVAAMCYLQFRRQIDGPGAAEAADIFG
jgi:hypothetical protein